MRYRLSIIFFFLSCSLFAQRVGYDCSAQDVIEHSIQELISYLEKITSLESRDEKVKFMEKTLRLFINQGREYSCVKQNGTKYGNVATVFSPVNKFDLVYKRKRTLANFLQHLSKEKFDKMKIVRIEVILVSDIQSVDKNLYHVSSYKKMCFCYDNGKIDYRNIYGVKSDMLLSEFPSEDMKCIDSIEHIEKSTNVRPYYEEDSKEKEFYVYLGNIYISKNR